MSSEAYEIIYPQIPIEDEIDIDLLWGEESEYMQLLKESFIVDFTNVNTIERKKDKVTLINDLCSKYNLNKKRVFYNLDTYQYLSRMVRLSCTRTRFSCTSIKIT